MSVISDAQLAQWRVEVKQRLPDVAVIQAVARESDGAGGWAEVWTAVAGGTVAGRIDPLTTTNARDQQIAGREALVITYRMTMEWDAPIAQDRRVVINNKTYEVISLDDEHSWRVSRRAIVTEAR